MFHSKTKEIQHILDGTNVVEVWVNDNVGDGAMLNSQYLRKYTDGSWKLQVRVNKTAITTPLQEYQAIALIEDKCEDMIYITTQVTAYDVNPTHYEEEE